MLNYIWVGMIVISIICSLMTGHIDELSNAISDGADKGIKLCISLSGTMSLWNGIMKIAEKSGITSFLAKIMSPVLHRLMPEHSSDKEAIGAVCANITANIMGLGNAATPIGIKAMKELQHKNRLSDKPDRSMIMFVVINTASLQIIPTTAAAMRKVWGSEAPYSILPYVWIASFGGLLVGISAVLLISHFQRS